MSWVTAIWSMTAAASLMLGMVYLFIWIGQREQVAHLAFSVIAAGVAAFSAIELALMHARSPAEYAILARWLHVPTWALVVSFVWFTWTYLRAGRRWLGWTVIVLRALALIINFMVPVNINFKQITALQEVFFLGEWVAAPVGVPSRWMLLAQGSLLLLVLFLGDAGLSVWRRGERRTAVIVGGSMALFVSQSLVQAVLILWGVVSAPLRVSLGYLVMLLAMGYELSRDMLRGAQLARQLHERERQSELEIAQLRENLFHIGRVSMMGQLSSALAHELNQPLGAILRNAEAAELLLQQPSPDLDELRAIIADIQQDDHRAGDVIDRLRGLLKRRDIEVHPLELGPLLTETAALVRAHATAPQVKLTISADPRLPPVRGDRIHLQQVLLNLILNAIDAVRDEPPERRLVAIRAQGNGSETVEVAVCDLGHGILREQCSQIFEPFFTTKSHGMGMGLPISRTIIEAHGGRIWAEHNPGGGTIFRFTLKSADKGSAG